MPSPFSGMDPFLEHPRFFPGLHSSLVCFAYEDLQKKLPEPFFAVLNERLWVESSERHIEPDIDLLKSKDTRSRTVPAFDYHVCVYAHGSDFWVYPIHLEEALPEIAVPLTPEVRAVRLDLQAIFERCYDAGPFKRRVKYDLGNVVPPLPTRLMRWANPLLRHAKGSR